MQYFILQTVGALGRLQLVVIIMVESASPKKCQFSHSFGLPMLPNEASVGRNNYSNCFRLTLVHS